MHGQRVTVVGNFNLGKMYAGGIVHFGDSAVIQPVSEVLTVQCTYPLSDYRSEPDFAQFKLFALPTPSQAAEVENASLRAHAEAACIRVDSIKVVSLSESSVVHVGSTGRINAINRSKHICVL